MTAEVITFWCPRWKPSKKPNIKTAQTVIMYNGEMVMLSKVGTLLTRSAILMDRTTGEEIYVSSKVKKIGKNAFGSSRGIEEVKLNEDLEIIEKEAFVGCFCLSKINMPACVLVDEDAFKQCPIR